MACLGEVDENKFTRADITISKLYSPVIRPLIIHSACISKRFFLSMHTICVLFSCILWLCCARLDFIRFHSYRYMYLELYRIWLHVYIIFKYVNEAC